jgi:inosine-uridine nucleoside N-ribohydrolase
VAYQRSRLPIARRLVKNYGPPRLRVFEGAAKARDLGTETAASRALAAALRAGPLTILALGPATNVATVLSKHPDLAPRVTPFLLKAKADCRFSRESSALDT